MKKQTFEILPLQGVYWKNKDLKLTFGMSVSEFDALLADGQKSQDDSGKVELYTNFFHAIFDSEEKLEQINFFESFPAKVYYDDTELFSVKNIVEYLKNKTDDVWEGNYFPALIYPSLGIMLVRFHKQDGEHERMIEVMKDPDSDDCHQYPPPPLKEFREFHFLPGVGVHGKELGDIKFGDSWEELIPNWKGYFPDHLLHRESPQTKIFGQKGFSLDFGKNNSCCRISIDSRKYDFFIDELKIGARNWKKEILKKDPQAYFLSNHTILICPLLNLQFMFNCRVIDILSPEQFIADEKYLLRYNSRD
jgi:hypothetical protein